VYIVIAMIAFGVLIAVHELGHFLSAKLLGVKVNEFAIGMGPKLMKKQGKETLYTLRALPFGGFCAMEGQDESMDDPRAFTSQKRWRRVIILVAGSAANIIASFLIIVILTSGAGFFVGTTITELVDAFPNAGENGIMPGDTIVSINGERLYYSNDFSMFMGMFEARGDRVVDIVLRRDGEKITLNNFPFERREYMIDGAMRLRYGLTFNVIEANAWEELKFSCYQTMNFARLIRVSLAQLFGGSVGVQDFSGPVGIVDAMNNIGQTAPTFGSAISSIAFFTAFIGVNLAIFNLLPIPAVDGGRILFVLLSWLIEKVSRRRLDPKYEGYIHTTAMVLLVGFMVFILVNDVLKLING